MTENNKHFLVFYSWQSDLPGSSNRQLIRRGLRNAASAVEESNSGLIVNIDEATRGTAGSPNIPLTILGKIKSSDLFVCDVTTINGKSEGVRKVANPNVIFELGYAVAHLGWERIVLLFNTEHGTFPDDLPFDFDRHRASPYNAVENPDKKQKDDLSKLLTDAMKAVVQSDPERPTDEQSPEAKKRNRDIENLKWILSTLHLPTIDQHMTDCPYMLQDRVLHFWESFNCVAGNSLFHLYDTKLLKAFNDLHESFHETISHDDCYHPNYSGSSYIFSNPGDFPLIDQKQKTWDAIQAASLKMKAALELILNCVRNEYLEVDIDLTNKAAWQEYVDFKKNQAELLGEADT